MDKEEQRSANRETGYVRHWELTKALDRREDKYEKRFILIEKSLEEYGKGQAVSINELKHINKGIDKLTEVTKEQSVNIKSELDRRDEKYAEEQAAQDKEIKAIKEKTKDGKLAKLFWPGFFSVVVAIVMGVAQFFSSNGDLVSKILFDK